MDYRNTVQDTENDAVPEAEKGLTEEEKGAVHEQQRPRAAVVYEIIRTEGESELRRPFSSLWWSGIAAGISIGFSFLSEAALSANLPPSDLKNIIAPMGYSVGFIIVILGRQQLFTENVLTAVLPIITRWSLAWLLSMLRLWGIVLASNIVGCFLFAAAFAYLPIASDSIADEMGKMVTHLMANTPLEMFARGTGSGWLIAALVWILGASSGLEFFIIGLLTYLIALFNFTHIVAGTAEALYGWLIGQITLPDAIFRFFLPVLAGNVFGGTVLFSVLSYAQVREEIFEENYWKDPSRKS